MDNALETQGTTPTAESDSQLREILELAISISAKNLNPTMLNQEFLKFSGIIANDWQLAKQPVLDPRMAQLSFQNGVNIVSQPGVISFTQGIRDENLENLEISEVARKYIDALPNAEYQALSITPKFLTALEGGLDAGRKFISETLLAPGSWQEFGKAPMQASLNLLYQLDQCQFTLTINEARIRQAEQATLPALLFSGSFNYRFTSDNPEERLNQVRQSLENWRENLETFREVVQQRFLAPQGSVFPGGLM